MHPSPKPLNVAHFEILAHCECGRDIPLRFQLDAFTTGQSVQAWREMRRLSALQQRVLELAAAGYTDREITRALGASLNQVKHAMRDILLRLNASNRAHAVFEGVQGGLLPSAATDNSGELSRDNQPIVVDVRDGTTDSAASSTI